MDFEYSKPSDAFLVRYLIFFLLERGREMHRYDEMEYFFRWCYSF